MNLIMLETSQMLEKHPLLDEKFNYKIKYIKMLEYFARKYSWKDPWAKQTLNLYIKKLIGNEKNYQRRNFNLQEDAQYILETKFCPYYYYLGRRCKVRVKRGFPFTFYSYRYCLIIDCLFICAYADQEKGKRIFAELSSLYHKKYQKKICKVFDSLYDSYISIDKIEQIRCLKSCWDANRAFVESKPIKVLVTANMSAGKSTLLNALIGRKVNKTQNDVCTAKIHNIVNKPYEDGLCYELDYLLELDADYKTLMEDNPDNHSSEIIVGTFFRTVNQPTKRVWLIDTPGVNSFQQAEQRLLAEKTICNTDIDLLIYVLNGENIGTEDDKKHLRFILEYYHGKILFVVNKLDRFRKEDSVGETLNAVIAELNKMGFEHPSVVPVSAYAAYLAKMKMFAEPFNEDEQDEYEIMLRKMQKPEYRLDEYYRNKVKSDLQSDCQGESCQLLLHSGLLHLENIIYNMR